MKCPMCENDSLIIEKNDSNYRSVRCLACGYTQLLKNMPRKKKKVNVFVIDDQKKVLVDAFIDKNKAKYLFKLISSLRDEK